jgi:hypothetical protein
VNSPITFDQLEVGKEFGSIVQSVDQEMMRRWSSLYPDEPVSAKGKLPPSIVQAIAMRAYLNLVVPRPPGNIHVAQSMKLNGAAYLNEPISVHVRCEGKEIRKERKLVRLAVSGRRADDKRLFDSTMTLIWAT